MPRLQLSDAEAELIVKVRHRTAGDTNWNAALGLAKTIVDAELSKRLPTSHVQLVSDDPTKAEPISVAGTITAILEQLDKQMREIKLL